MPSSTPTRLAAPRRAAPSVPKLLGAGYLAFTVDQGEHTERYQGIVELTGTTLAECVHHYFRQSEQFKAGLKVAAGAFKDDDGGLSGAPARSWSSACRPTGAQGSAEGRDLARPLTDSHEEAEDGWRRALILMGSATSAELVDPDAAAMEAGRPAVPRRGRQDLPAARSAPRLPLLARAGGDGAARLPARRDRGPQGRRRPGRDVRVLQHAARLRRAAGRRALRRAA